MVVSIGDTQVTMLNLQQINLYMVYLGIYGGPSTVVILNCKYVTKSDKRGHLS